MYNILQNKLTTLKKLLLGWGERRASYRRMRILVLEVVLWETVLIGITLFP
jgi:hypothetical protein